MLITTCLAITSDNYDWNTLDINKMMITFGYKPDYRFSVGITSKWDCAIDKFVIFNVSSFNQKEFVNISYNRILEIH